jgi:hypothetical protein
VNSIGLLSAGCTQWEPAMRRALRLSSDSRASAAHGAVVVIGRPPGVTRNLGVSYPLTVPNGTAARSVEYRYAVYMNKQLTGT